MLVFGWAMFATWWFWVFAICFAVTVWSVCEDAFEPPLFALVIGIALIHFFGKLPVLEYLSSNWATLLMYLAIYLVAGVGWSFFKWYLYLVDRRESLKKGKTHPSQWLIPKARDNKRKITTWMIYWVFSAFGFVFGDMVKIVYDYVYSIFGNLYDRVTHHVFKDFREEK
jgi:hypothetical protein